MDECCKAGDLDVKALDFLFCTEQLEVAVHG